MSKLTKFFIVLILALTILSGAAAITPEKAEALSAGDVVEFVVAVPDAVFDFVVDGVVWTVERIVDACESFAVCDWAVEKIKAAVLWLNTLCDEFVVCSWTKDSIAKVSSLLGELCNDVVVCSAAVDWMEAHPGWTVLIQLGVAVVVPAAGAGLVIKGGSGPLSGFFQKVTVLKKSYATSKGAIFEVPPFARVKGHCYTKCGEWVPKEARDPKRLIKGSEREKFLDTVCGKDSCTVGGKTFPRDEATIDHKIPHSCGGATTWANSEVLHKDDNIAKGGCRELV